MHAHGSDEEEKPCTACSDFTSWAKAQTKNKPATSNAPPPKRRDDCPLLKEDLGTSTWGFLHSLAAYFPEKPTKQQSESVTQFFNIFAQFYPCEPCALDFQVDIKENPVQATSSKELSQWLCERHNTVNKKLGKPLFDCSTVHERWKAGWKDGSCD